MNTTTQSTNRMQLVAVVERGEGDQKKSFWTRIGVAFENRDRSWNLRFDYLPARMGETTIQLRKIEPKEDDSKDAEPEPPPAARARVSEAPRAKK